MRSIDSGLVVGCVAPSAEDPGDLHRLPLGYRLAVVRHAKGESQQAVARHLSEATGRTVRQAQISEIEHLRVLSPRVDLVHAIDVYCGERDGIDFTRLRAKAAALRAGQLTLPPVPDQSASEPVLGPHQVDLLTALRQRLAEGPAMSEADLAGFRDLAKILGLRHL